MPFLHTYNNAELVHLHESKNSFLNQIRIRPFNKLDLDRIRYLFEISFPVVYGDEFFQCLAVQFFKGNRLITYVAEYFDGDDPIIVGFVMMQVRSISELCNDNSIIIEQCQFDRVVYLQNIAVLPQYKRYGLGSYLIQMSISLFKDNPTCAGVCLHMQASNNGNIQFYEKNGFQRICKMSNFYLINEKWEDSILYFYPFGGATILPKVKPVRQVPIITVLSILSIVGLYLYSIYH